MPETAAARRSLFPAGSIHFDMMRRQNDMKTLPVALQLYTVRTEAEKDFAAAMKKVKEIGYDYVEPAGLYGHTAKQVRQIFDENGLKAISAHVPFAEMTADLSKTIDDYLTIGCEYMAIPYLGEGMRPGDAGFDKVLEDISRIGKACAKEGLTLLYHNHDFEFIRMPDGSYGLDYMYSHVPASELQTELDVCWVNVGGEDPAQYIRKYDGRSPVVHLKDFTGSKSESMYELIGIESEKKEVKKNTFEFRPVGYGKQNFPSILEASVAAGAKYVVVEQDQSYDTPCMDAAKMSREYLKTLGW